MPDDKSSATTGPMPDENAVLLEGISQKDSIWNNPLLAANNQINQWNNPFGVKTYTTYLYDNEEDKVTEEEKSNVIESQDNTLPVVIASYKTSEEIILERQQYAKLGLSDLTRILKKQTQDPFYDIRNLQKVFFGEAANGSEEQNLIILYYLLQKGWQKGDKVPTVKHKPIGSQIVVLSTFEGYTNNRSHATIAAFIYIDHLGDLLDRKYTDEMPQEFFLYENEENYDNAINVYADNKAKKNRLVPFAFKRPEPKEIMYNKEVVKRISQTGLANSFETLRDFLCRVTINWKITNPAKVQKEVNGTFTLLVKEVQKTIFPRDPARWDGMLNPETISALQELKKSTGNDDKKMALESLYAKFIQEKEAMLVEWKAKQEERENDDRHHYHKEPEPDFDGRVIMRLFVMYKSKVGASSFEEFDSMLREKIKKEKENLISGRFQQQTSAIPVGKKLILDKRQMLFREQAAHQLGYIGGEGATPANPKGAVMYENYKKALFLYLISTDEDEKLAAMASLEEFKTALILFYTNLYDIYQHDRDLWNTRHLYGHFPDSGVVEREIQSARSISEIAERFFTGLEFLDIYFGLKFTEGNFDEALKQYGKQNLIRQNVTHQTEYEISKKKDPDSPLILIHAYFQPSDDSLENIDLYHQKLPQIQSIPLDIYYYKTTAGDYELTIIIEGRNNDPFLVRGGKDFDDLLTILNEQGEFLTGTIHGHKPNGEVLMFHTEGSMKLSEKTGYLALGLFAAGVVLLPFTAGFSTGLMLLATVVGGISSAARLKELYDSGRLTPANATPEIVSLVATVLPLFSSVKGLAKLSGLSFLNGRTYIALSKTVAVADAVVQGVVLTDTVIEQLAALENPDNKMSDEEKYEAKKRILLMAMAVGSLIIVSSIPEMVDVKTLPGKNKPLRNIKGNDVDLNGTELRNVAGLPETELKVTGLNAERNAVSQSSIVQTPQDKRYKELSLNYGEDKVKMALRDSNGNLDNAETMLTREANEAAKRGAEFPLTKEELNPENHPWFFENGKLKTAETHPYLYNGDGTPKRRAELFDQNGEFIEDIIRNREASIDRDITSIKEELEALKNKKTSGSLLSIVPLPSLYGTVAASVSTTVVRTLFRIVEKYRDTKKRLNLEHEISILNFEKEMQRSGRFSADDLTNLRSAIIYVWDDVHMTGLTTEEKELAVQYRTKFKNTQFTNYELADLHRRGYVVNETGRLVQVGDKSADLGVSDYIEHSDLVKRKIKMSDEEEAALDQLRRDREATDAKIREREKSFKDPANPSKSELDELNRMRYEKVKTSERLGELASDVYMRNLGYELVYTGSGRGTIDKLYRNKVGKLVVVEAKGGGSKLGSRVVKSKELKQKDLRASQGTKPYLQDIAYEMIARGGNDEEIGRLILSAIQKENLSYLHIRQPFEPNGKLSPIEVEEFDISGPGFKDLRK